MTSGSPSRPTEARPPCSAVLRAVREARGVTQEGWAAWLGVSEATVRRWETGTAVPNADVERALIAHCEERGLFRAYDQGPLRGLTLTPTVLRDVLAEARLALSSRAQAPSPVTTGAVAARTDSTDGLPSGTVTLLFTDIEDSTPLTLRLGARYPEVLATHRTLVRALFTEHGGYEVDTQGDSFFVAFPHAGKAVEAAVAIQRALAAHPWPEGGTVRVRMGLHTGEPIRTAEGYTGLDVVRGARIRDVGHGGQILLSARTVAEVGPEPAGAGLRDLGTHRLKGLPQPERIFQIMTPDLPGEFPPLHVPTSLDSHYDLVTKALTEGRLVLFAGAGVNTCGRTAGHAWQAGRFDCLPSDRELADHLASTFGYPSGEPRDLVRVSQHIAVTTGLGPLYDELRTLFDADYPPTLAHHFIATLPAALRAAGSARPYQLIVTTTYDDALERAFEAAGEPYDLVSYVAEGEHRGAFMHRSPEGIAGPIERPNEYRGLSLDQRSVILKIHGAIDRVGSEWDSFVITEDHYIDYLTRADVSNLLPVTLAAKMRRSHYLFLGYRLRDWNLRVILHRIWGQQKLAYKSWAIPSDSQSGDQEFWRTREVDVLNITLETYLRELQERIAGPRAQAV
jgi:class 3 adenylate cyclase/DNA-binding XRE family transcriptional regulator